MERKLASIQKIEKLDDIEGADRIELATILGWRVIVKKGEFNEGDLAIFIEPDSILPEHPIFGFMEKYKYRVKTIKIRGVYSQGLALPITDLSKLFIIEPGVDITELIGITKYSPPIPQHIAGETKGNFPMFIPKTDEPRIQSIPFILDQYKGEDFYISEKIDGSSSSFYYYKGEFGVCSRNIELKETNNNIYWFISEKYNLAHELKHIGNIVIQGEIIGPKIQKNRYGLDELDLYVFNSYDIENQYYHSIDDLKVITSRLGLKMVPIWCEHCILDHTVDDLIELSKGISMLTSNLIREGIVIRRREETHHPTIGRVSFKAINPDYLIKYE